MTKKKILLKKETKESRALDYTNKYVSSVPGKVKQYTTGIFLGASVFFGGVLFQNTLSPGQASQGFSYNNMFSQVPIIQTYNKSVKQANRFSVNMKTGSELESKLNLTIREPSNLDLRVSEPKEFIYSDFNKFLQEKRKELNKPKPIPEVLEKIEAKKGDYLFIVNKEAQTLQVYKVEHKLIDEFDVSTGKNNGEKKRSGDHKTPTGIYEVVSVEKSSNWRHNGELAYGPYFARLSTGSWDFKGNHNPNGRSPIGIHGTNEPEHLGFRKSRGCVRMFSDIIQYYVVAGYLKPGTKIAVINDINHSPLDKSFNNVEYTHLADASIDSLIKNNYQNNSDNILDQLNNGNKKTKTSKKKGISKKNKKKIKPGKTIKAKDSLDQLIDNNTNKSNMPKVITTSSINKYLRDNPNERKPYKQNDYFPGKKEKNMNYVQKHDSQKKDYNPATQVPSVQMNKNPSKQYNKQSNKPEPKKKNFEQTKIKQTKKKKKKGFLRGVGDFFKRKSREVKQEKKARDQGGKNNA